MSDFFPTKKEMKRATLSRNKSSGRSAEDQYRFEAAIYGKEVIRTGRGHDFRERTRDPWNGKVTSSKRVEVKSSRTAPLSKLQKREMKKGNYKVVRYSNTLF